MKHHAAGRPVGKCKGCRLNMRTICAAGLDPKSEWDRGRCRGRNDTSVLEAYYRPVSLTGAKFAKLARRTRATERATRSRQNGRVSPGRYVAESRVRA